MSYLEFVKIKIAVFRGFCGEGHSKGHSKGHNKLFVYQRVTYI